MGGGALKRTESFVFVLFSFICFLRQKSHHVAQTDLQLIILLS